MTDQLPPPPSGAPTPPPPPSADKPPLWKRKWFWVVVVAVIVVIGIASTGGGNDSSTTATPASTTAAATKPQASKDADVSHAPTTPPRTDPPTPAPTTAPPPPPDQVTYQCSGNAPAGIDITYGASGSSIQATSLPFSHTDPVDPSASYFVVQAQLQGGGQVTCSTTVTADGSPVTKTATASGGYNIAAAQVCSDFMGGWQTCG